MQRTQPATCTSHLVSRIPSEQIFYVRDFPHFSRRKFDARTKMIRQGILQQISPPRGALIGVWPLRNEIRVGECVRWERSGVAAPDVRFEILS